MEKILLTGVAGGLGHLLVRALRGRAALVGVDRAPADRFPPGLPVHALDLRQSGFDELMRKERPRTVVHLATLGSPTDGPRRRGDRGLEATRALLERCREHGVARLVAVSTGLVYGAFGTNAYRIDEGTAVSAAANGPGLRDWVETDALVASFVWQAPEVRTCLLRFVPVLGRTIRSLVRSYLELPRVPMAMGFDPMVQFMDEEDAVRALATALGHDLRGIYNVTGPGEVPLSTAIRECRRVPWPVPTTLLRAGLAVLGDGARFPSGFVDFLKYPVSLDGRRFEQDTGHRPKVDLPEIFERMRR